MLKPPRDKHLIEIKITSFCDLACGGCTEMIAHQHKRYHMSIPNFRKAVESLVDWPGAPGKVGVVGVFGGNPCLHPDFEEICAIMRELLPRERRGLLSNRIFKHGKVIKDTYGWTNLVCHGSEIAKKEMLDAGLPIQGGGAQAQHTPTLVAIKDVVHDEAKMWELIHNCELNAVWSGAIDEDPEGNIRAWYCETASAMARVYEVQGGIPVVPGWWKNDMSVWDADVKRWCPSCGFALGLHGNKDMEYTDIYSKTHAGLFEKKPNRKRLLMVDLPPERINERASPVDYLNLTGKNK